MLTKSLSDNYQEFTRSTICYGNKDALNYLVLGLISEIVELACAVTKKDMVDEAGDVCWYIYRIIDNFGVNFYDRYIKYTPGKPNPILISVGDIASLHKKYIRGDKVQDYPEKMMDLAMQEFLYFESYFGKDTIPSILLKNKDKLIERQNKGVIRGSGETVKERQNGQI